MTTPTAYSIYLMVSLVATVWVARTLHSRGRIFLVDAMRGNEDLADSINSLLVVGFYLVNFGYVLLALKYGRPPEELAGAIEALATKIGLVLLILGVMHFINIFVISGMRRRGLDEATSA
ncbi:MAG: hypothetical protein V3V75_05725, partial [Thermoguttaceae bacterium]